MGFRLNREELAEWDALLLKDMEFPTWEIFKNSFSSVKANLKIKSSLNSGAGDWRIGRCRKTT